jgi:predicted DNA-binding transcriptional regulator AlpA
MTDSGAIPAWHPDQLLSPQQFCEWAQVSLRTYRQWCTDGHAPRRIRVGRHTRILARDAVAWAQSKYVDA